MGWLRIAAGAGISAAILLVLAWVVAGFAHDDYDWVRQDVSDLGAETAERGWIQDLGDVLAGLCLVVFALGLYRALGDRWSGRVGAVLVGVFGVMLVLTGAYFDLDCSLADESCREAEHSSQHSTHEVLAGFGGISAFAMPFVLAWRFRNDPSWRDLWPFALACGVAALAAFAIYLVLQWGTGGGIAQRLLIVVFAVFLAGLAWRLWVAAEPRSALVR